MKLTFQTQGNKTPDVLMRFSIVICMQQLLKRSSLFEQFARLSSTLLGMCGLENSLYECVCTQN